MAALAKELDAIRRALNMRLFHTLHHGRCAAVLVRFVVDFQFCRVVCGKEIAQLLVVQLDERALDAVLALFAFVVS